MLVKHDGAEDHIYGTGDDRKVVRVSADKSESDSSDSSDSTSTKTSTSTGSTSTDKAPSSEKTKPVDGRAYADITAGPRKDLYLNTSGNARDGKTFVLVKKDDREYHIYGTGKNREVFMVKDPAAKTARRDTTTSLEHHRHAPLRPTAPRRTGRSSRPTRPLPDPPRREGRRDVRPPAQQLIGHTPARCRPQRDPPRAVATRDREPLHLREGTEKRPTILRTRPRARPHSSRLNPL